MKNVFKLAVAIAAGAALMYYLDPATGRRRRALVRDQGVSARHDVARFARARTRRAADRLRGLVARARARIVDEPVDDDRLLERVRARLGHVVEDPGAFEVKVRDGRVVLSGVAASRAEIEEVIGVVAAVPGVGEVVNLLSPAMRDSAATADARH